MAVYVEIHSEDVGSPELNTAFRRARILCLVIIDMIKLHTSVIRFPLSTSAPILPGGASCKCSEMRLLFLMEYVQERGKISFDGDLNKKKDK